MSDDNNSVVYDENSDSDTEIIKNINDYVDSYSNSNRSIDTNSYNSRNNSRLNSYENKYFEKKFLENRNINDSFNSNSYNNSYNNSYEDKYHESRNVYEQKCLENVKNIKNCKVKSIQKKNTKLKYKIVLHELKNNKLKDKLNKANFDTVLRELLLKKEKYNNLNQKYKLCYDIVLKDIIIKELTKYYWYGNTYKGLLKSLE